MNKKIFFGRSIKDLLFALGPSMLVLLLVIVVAYKFLDPAPPTHLVIATGDNEGDYQVFAQQYQELLKKEGVHLEIRSSSGPVENLQLLENDDSNVDAAFVQDGVGAPATQPDLVSLGSLDYEPLWGFYRGGKILKRFSELKGKKIAVGRPGRGTRLIALQLLKESGVDETNSKLISIGGVDGAQALKKGEVDVAFFLLTPEDPLIEELGRNPNLHLMSVDQAEAITRQIPSMHHLILPHGAFDLEKNLPDQDSHLVASTATLLVRDDLHPALSFLLLKAAKEVHGGPGMFEKRGEFPINKDDQFPLSPDAKQFYKSGGPFWQRYLPFWLAAWIDRFILIVIPVMAIVLPMLRTIPRLYKWRIRTRIYKRYGELKFLETRLKTNASKSEAQEFIQELDVIEERVNKMKVPLEFAEHIYSLRGHIHFVRERLGSSL